VITFQKALQKHRHKRLKIKMNNKNYKMVMKKTKLLRKKRNQQT
jgi:hypothetical protein